MTVVCNWYKYCHILSRSAEHLLARLQLRLRLRLQPRWIKIFNEGIVSSVPTHTRGKWDTNWKARQKNRLSADWALRFLVFVPEERLQVKIELSEQIPIGRGPTSIIFMNEKLAEKTDENNDCSMFGIDFVHPAPSLYFVLQMQCRFHWQIWQDLWAGGEGPGAYPHLPTMMVLKTRYLQEICRTNKWHNWNVKNVRILFAGCIRAGTGCSDF